MLLTGDYLQPEWFSPCCSKPGHSRCVAVSRASSPLGHRGYRGRGRKEGGDGGRREDEGKTCCFVAAAIGDAGAMLVKGDYEESKQAGRAGG